MGMDVHGLKPTSQVGAYFRNNVWWWRPLANYIELAAPHLYKKVGDDGIGWHYNDGDGLNAQDSHTLAKILRKDVELGKTEAYEEEYKRLQAELPDQECGVCEGTGKRQPPPNGGAGKEPCKACDETGKQDHSQKSYPFDTDNVKEFTEFLENCGGFEID
tara:strand:- start:773 stop:1252 length:480 start_codon:yes stop_codon:yes gene_type:complete